jgi:hypothetical protein
MLWLLACTSTPPADSSPSSCEGDDETGAVVSIAPYVQDLRPDSAWVLWETDSGSGSRLDHASGFTCGVEVPAIEGADPSLADGRVHAVQLTGLEPDTVYEATARTGDLDAGSVRFRTPAQDPEIVRLVAMSDMQRDDAHPEKFGEIVQQGVLPMVRDRYDPDLTRALDLALIPGDLVDNGWKAEEWREDFFRPAAELLAEVPLYPVPGNHEGGSPLFFRYFQLPAEGLDEHAWVTDRGQLRVFGLDSNNWSEDAQMAWLGEQLDQTCSDDDVQVVFAQLHHPHLSELWTPGEDDFATRVVTRLEAFTEDCGKPSVHFFGHTHGYSRGESRDHQHLMVNVASAGGSLDRWGTTSQEDYPEFAVSQDHYGFVLVEVGPDRFTIDRFSRGTPEEPLDNVHSDSVTIWLDNAAPDTPTLEGLDCAGLSASTFNDLEQMDHHGSHWQAAASCDFEGELLLDVWQQDRNEYMGVDTQQGADLTTCAFALEGEACARVRYRDAGLAWSDWSAPVELAPPDCN